MVNYITINFGTTSAAPKAVEWDKAMIIGDGSPSSLTDSKLYALTTEDWSSQLVEDGFSLTDQFYESVAIFFAASPTPQNLFGYAHLSGAVITYADVPMDYVSGDVWEIPIKPPAGFQAGQEQVKFWCCGEDIGTGTSTINAANGSLGVAFNVEKDPADNWTGRLGFPNGLSGETCGIVKPLTSDCKITVSFTAGSQANISSVLSEYNINMVSMALENDATLKNYTDTIFGVSQLDDMMIIRNMIAGKSVEWFYALPGDAEPEDVITDTSTYWKDLKNLLGAREDISAIKAKPSATNDDMASGLMGMVSATHPHKQVGFAEPHMGILEPEPLVNQGKWADGQISTIMKRTELAGNPLLLTFGFTFGSGDASKIEGVRCRYIMAQTLRNQLWGLLAERDTLMSYEGCQAIKARIRGAFKILTDQRIIDKLVTVYIPIEEDLRKNTEAGRIARQQQTVPAVEIEYEWYTSLEKIIITRAENIAT
ncbi:MAG: hypothetical protein V3V14_08340 [Saprospiraceae bacterium]